ncbi:MAG: hypothetical protein GF350_08320 [Chitinivibrionales bacterium]|nr:hypothetical protein [Chitinivibrionales bacterium]
MMTIRWQIKSAYLLALVVCRLTAQPWIISQNGPGIGDEGALLLDAIELRERINVFDSPVRTEDGLPLHIGAGWNRGRGIDQKGFVGLIDEVRLYNGELSPTDIQLLASGQAVIAKEQMYQSKALHGGTMLDKAIAVIYDITGRQIRRCNISELEAHRLPAETKRRTARGIQFVKYEYGKQLIFEKKIKIK